MIATTMDRNGKVEFLLSAALILAILTVALALFGRPARGDGLRGPPGPPPQYQAGPQRGYVAQPQGPPPIPSSSCTMTAIQLAYQTGRRELAYLGAEHCIAAGERGVVLPYGYYGPYVPPRGFIPPGWVVPY